MIAIRHQLFRGRHVPLYHTLQSVETLPDRQGQVVFEYEIKNKVVE